MVLDAPRRVSGPLGHLAGDAGDPASAGSRAGGFGSEAPFEESGGLLLISLLMEGVAGGSGKQDGRLFEFIGAGPGHDPLVPLPGFRPSV